MEANLGIFFYYSTPSALLASVQSCQSLGRFRARLQSIPTAASWRAGVGMAREGIDRWDKHNAGTGIGGWRGEINRRGTKGEKA